jgi:hypothetical protein
MVGQRLVKFLSVILPTHTDYYKESDIKASAARKRSQDQLSVVSKYLDQIALLIDKEEHEDYISSVLNQHQQGISNEIQPVSRQNRDEMYHTDDTDDEGDRSSSYLATNNTRESDSTDKRDNISAGNTIKSPSIHRQSTNIAHSGGQQRFPLPVTSIRNNALKQSDHQNIQDSSVISDSVDVCIDNTNSSTKNRFLSEDPISTPSHTLLRVSPYQDIQTSQSKQQPITITPVAYTSNRGQISNKSEESFSSDFGSVTSNGKIAQSNMPIGRSHWIANRPATRKMLPKTTDNSFSSVDRNVITDTTETPKISNIVSQATPQSPGGSVRNIIRSWPPKQDPPGDPPGMTGTTIEPKSVTNDVKVPVTKTQAIQQNLSELKGSSQNNSSNFETSESLRLDVKFPTTTQEPSDHIKTSLNNVDTINLKFAPMTDLQVMADEFHKGPPSRDQESIIRRKSMKNTKHGEGSDPNATSSRVRFSSSSHSASSYDRSEIESSDNIPTSSSRYSNLDRPRYNANAISSSTHNASSPLITSNMPITENLKKSSEIKDEMRRAPANELNVSLDNMGFPKIFDEIVVKPNQSNFTLAPIGISHRSDTICSPSDNTEQQNSSFRLQWPSNDEIESNKAKNRELARTMLNETKDIQTKQDSNESAPRNESQNIISRQYPHNARRSGPVDLDASTSSNGSASPHVNGDAVLANSRGYITDGLDYILPLPKSSSSIRKASPILSSYAPPAADWSLDEELDSNRRFVRENSTMSIDSTEFSSFPSTTTSSAKQINFSDLVEADNEQGTDWTPVWSPNDFDSMFNSDGKIDQQNTSKSSIGRPDLSYEAWDQVWNEAASKEIQNQSHSSDSRKRMLTKVSGVQRGVSCTDRTTSTGSTSSSRSRDISHDLGPLSQTSELLDPFSSRVPIETPFLRNEHESPLMIDSMAEQRLRVSMKPSEVTMSTNNLIMPPNSVGLYGSLKGFHSLDCILPFDHDNSDQYTESGRSSILLCRSRATNVTNHRSPNDEDWEETSLLMIESQQNSPKFKNCVRCLLK